MIARSRKPLLTLVALYFVIAVPAGAESYIVTGPFPIAVLPGAQRVPAVSGDIVLWEDDSLAQTRIRGCNLAAGEEVTIPYNGPQANPAIWGSTVVWEDSRSGNPDIYGCDLTTGQEFPIACGLGAEQSPSIWGDWVTWHQSGPNGADIHAYNLATKESLTVCSQPGDQLVPKIWEDWIVWQDLRTGRVDFYGFNLSTREETALVTSPGERGAHSLNNGLLVFEALDAFGESDIAALSLAGGSLRQICADPGYQFIPAVWDNLIVWADWRDGITGIRAYDVATGESFWVLSPDAERTMILSLAISGNLVVWEDSTDWNPDIYGAFVEATPEPSCLAALGLGVIALLSAGRVRRSRPSG